MSLFPKPKPAAENTFAEHRIFHPADVLLRKAGFRIHARPAHGEPTWERGGKLYRETEALALENELALARQG